MIQMSSKSKAEPNKGDGKQKLMDNSGLESMQSLGLYNAKQSGMKFENLGYNILKNTII